MNQTNPQLSFKSTPDVWPDEKGGNHPFSISRESKLVTFWWKSVAAAALSAPTCLKVNWDKLTAENADKGPAVWFVMKASRGVAAAFFWAQASFLESGQQWVWKPSSLGVYRILLNVFGHKFWSQFEKPRPDIGISGGEFTPAAAAVESSYRIITTSQGLPFPAHTAPSILKDRPTNAKEFILCLVFAASCDTHHT